MTGDKAQRLLELLRGQTIVRAVGAHNGLTARLVQQAGFEAVWASSLELSASHGLPDASLLSMTQYLDAAETMDRAVTVPIIADCDTGFGGPLNVAHMIRGYEGRGIAAVCIEDKVFPKRNSLANVRHELLATEDFVEKIRAAVATRHPGCLVVVARTEALVVGAGTAEALTRARAYAHAGADAILVHSKQPDPGQVLRFAEAWDLDVPLVAVPTSYPEVSEELLFAAGYRLVIYANHGLRSMIRGVSHTLGELHKHRSAHAIETLLCSVDDVFALQGDKALGGWS